MARRPRTLTACAAATAVAALTLSACGGGDDTSSGKIKGAHKDDNSSSSAAPSPTSGPKRPEIKLPKSFQMDFQDWTDSDPEKQAVLSDGREEIKAGYSAIIENSTDTDALRFYDTKPGLSQTQKWIKSYTGKKVTVTGKLPYSDPKVSLIGKSRKVAELRYCTDESNAYTEDRKTGGDRQGTPAGKDPKRSYTSILQKDARGVWKTHNVDSKEGCS